MYVNGSRAAIAHEKSDTTCFKDFSEEQLIALRDFLENPSKPPPSILMDKFDFSEISSKLLLEGAKKEYRELKENAVKEKEKAEKSKREAYESKEKTNLSEEIRDWVKTIGALVSVATPLLMMLVKKAADGGK